MRPDTRHIEWVPDQGPTVGLVEPEGFDPSLEEPGSRPPRPNRGSEECIEDQGPQTRTSGHGTRAHLSNLDGRTESLGFITRQWRERREHRTRTRQVLTSTVARDEMCAPHAHDLPVKHHPSMDRRHRRSAGRHRSRIPMASSEPHIGIRSLTRGGRCRAQRTGAWCDDVHRWLKGEGESTEGDSNSRFRICSPAHSLSVIRAWFRRLGVDISTQPMGSMSRHGPIHSNVLIQVILALESNGRRDGAMACRM